MSEGGGEGGADVRIEWSRLRTAARPGLAQKLRAMLGKRKILYNEISEQKKKNSLAFINEPNESCNLKVLQPDKMHIFPRDFPCISSWF